jgi:uncharacterized damage-inducible protein DinB
MRQNIDEDTLRGHLARLLAWGDAHVDFDKAVNGLPVALRGKVPRSLPYSAWQLLEHIRLTQEDILEFCVNAGYKEREWPADYWPSNPAPPSARAWSESIRKYKKDREALQALAMDSGIDLGAKIPHGNGQTYLRELLLVADHTSHHLGQLILVRRLLGAWT